MSALLRCLVSLALVLGLSTIRAFAQPSSTPATTGDGSPPVTTQWQVLPPGLLYPAYLAGEKEPRTSWSILRDRHQGTVWEMAVGGRVGLVRRGAVAGPNASGWQIDLEGAAMPRLDPESSNRMDAVDYRAGLLWTARRRAVAVKVGYYHLSAHLGDEFLLSHPEVERLDYVRDSVITGLMLDLTADLQVYGEAAFAFIRHGGAEPLELQAGVQYGGIRATPRRGAPFAAINIHLRQELQFGGGVNVLAGWGWFSHTTGHRLRLGIQGYAGKSVQYSTFRRSERMVGPALWFDF